MSYSPRGSLEATRRAAGGERRRTGSTASVNERRKREAKVDQIIQHFCSKTTHIILGARITSDAQSCPPGGAQAIDEKEGPRGCEGVKRDRWFNLDLEDYDYFREELKTWKGASALLFPALADSPSSSSSSTHTVNFSSVPTLVLEVLLDLSDIPAHQCVVLSNSQGQNVRLSTDDSTTTGGCGQSRRRNIILERWTVVLTPPMPAPPGPELPTTYRHAIVHMRALYMYVRTVPVWQLQKRLRKSGTKESGVLKLGCKLSTGDTGAEAVDMDIAIDEPLLQGDPSESIASFNFTPIQTPLGHLQTAVTFRNNVEFGVEDNETMLSRFIDEDFFKPKADRPGSVPLQAAGGGQQTGPPAKRYGSLSSAYLLGPGSSNAPVGATQTKQPTSPSSLTAAIRAADEPALVPPRRVSGASIGNTGSALTARLTGTQPRLQPVVSNAVPSAGMVRGSSSVPQGEGVAMTKPFSNSPLSGPLALVHLSHPPTTSSPLSPGFVYQGSASSGPSHSAAVAARPVPVAQPTIRRYSSSRASRSYGRDSSSGGSLGADVGSIGRRMRLGLDQVGLGSPHGEVYGTSLGRAVTGSSASADEADDINTFLALLDSKPQLKQSAVLDRGKADEVMKKLASSVYGEGGGLSPRSGSNSPDASAGSGQSRPASWRLSSLSGRPPSALDGLREEEEPREPNAPRLAFAPRSYGSYGSYLRQSPLSASPGMGPPGTGGDVPFPRYAPRRRRSVEMSGGMLAQQQQGPGSTGLASSFEDGPVGKLELSLEQDPPPKPADMT